MAFNEKTTAFYKYVDEKEDIVYEGSLPQSAVDQYDIYMAMMAYWESKTPTTWNVLREYILSNTKVYTKKGNIQLDIKKDLDFKQVNTLISKYMEMASNFFTSPQKQEIMEIKEI